jgi:dihydropteroate synthase
MGVLNVTPDSFSDGGLWASTDAAIAHGVDLAAAGADVVDVGGESTRPGAELVGLHAELERVLPVVRALAERGIRVSIDTMHADTARAAVQAGASIVNDVSGGLADPAMGPLVADLGVRYVAMHWRGHSDRMNEFAHYGDAAHEVRDELFRRVDALTAQGVAASRIIVDPGLGFAKNAEHNWDVLRHLADFEAAGLPVLIGASRKRFLSEVVAPGAPMTDRDLPTAIITALAARDGVWGVRVHDVASTRVALDVVRAWRGGEDVPAASGGAAQVGLAQDGLARGTPARGTSAQGRMDA